MEVTEDRIILLEDKVEKIGKIVIGNGDIGMAETLRNVGKDVADIKATLTTHVESHEAEEKRTTSRRERLLEKLLLGTGAVILSGIGSSIAYIIHIYPDFMKLLETVP